MSASLVGSEMCIRDRQSDCLDVATYEFCPSYPTSSRFRLADPRRESRFCLLYTSDAADDM
eukprot:550430-Alexandrium_andersonii.AAC.1